jgi:hypothetical protein
MHHNERTGTMRSAKALLALVVIGLAGCSNTTAASHSAGPAPAGHATAEPSAARAKPAQARTEAGARAAAARFYRLYSGRQFAASWDLLAPAAKRQVAKRVWIGVHGGCLAAIGAGGRVIRSVTVFGDAAIVTHQLTGAQARHRIARDIFNYADGRWGYSPADLSVYLHGSIAADISAAKAAGLCSGRKNATL